jgi:hypothetical protein
MDRWTWELPGGYLDPDEDQPPARRAKWSRRPGGAPEATTGQFPAADGTADFENLIYLGEGAEDTGRQADINEAERVAWIPLDAIRDMLAEGEIIGAAAQIGPLHVLAKRSAAVPAPQDSSIRR